MTPKEKANELIVKFAAHAAGSTGDQNWINAKNCAIIAVDEILKSTFSKTKSWDRWGIIPDEACTTEYWQSVKDELLSL